MTDTNAQTTLDDTSSMVSLIAFNCTEQTALDDDGNVWVVDGWYDDEGEELERFIDPDGRPGDTSNYNWPEWEQYVSYCTAWAIQNGDKVWVSFFPDDFNGQMDG